MGVDVFDILAVILGVWFSVRKLDAQGRRPEAFPHVAKEAFLGWQRAEVSAYQLGVFGCFSKVLADLFFTHVLAPDLPYSVVRPVGAAIDLSWILVLVVTFFRTQSARKQRRELGIVLGGFVVTEEGADEESSETSAQPGLAGEEADEAEEAVERVSPPSNDSPEDPAGEVSAGSVRDGRPGS